MVNASSRTPGMPCAGMWVLPLIIKSLTVSPAEQIANDSRLMPRLTPKGFNIYRKKTERRDRLTPKGHIGKTWCGLPVFFRLAQQILRSIFHFRQLFLLLSQTKFNKH